jgi:hypothetical protein
MALRQKQPAVAGVLGQTPSGFYQPLLRASERSVVNSLRQHQPPPRVPQLVRNLAQPKA